MTRVHNNLLASAKAALAVALALGLGLLVSPGTVAQDEYMEDPRPILDSAGRYPTALVSGGRALVLWQESQVEAGLGQAWLSLAVRRGADWDIRRRVAGPLPFRGNESPLYSACVGADGEILVAATGEEASILFLRSTDGGASFERGNEVKPSITSVTPRVFALSGGGYAVYVTVGSTDSLSIAYAYSADGLSWSDFAPLVQPEDGLRLSFLPSQAPIPGGGDMVLFQSLSSGERPTFQLWSKTTMDGGRTWGPAVQVTDFDEPTEPRAGKEGPQFYDNQRPFLSNAGGRLRVAWERRYTGSGSQQVYVAEIDPDGKATPGGATRVSAGRGACSDPQIVDKSGRPAIVWYDDRSGRPRVYMAVEAGLDWASQELSSQGIASFGRAVFASGRLFAFWQRSDGSGRERVMVLEPDESARPPLLQAVDFGPGRPARRDGASIAWSAPEDPSGIAGYSFVWGRDPGAEPPREIGAPASVTRTREPADEDGSWWFAIRAVDFAGNWSEPARIEFVRDTTPPPPPAIIAPPLDDLGWLSSSDFEVAWDAMPDPQTTGYAWAWARIAPVPRELRDTASSPAADLALDGAAEALARSLAPESADRGMRRSLDFANVEDGIYALAVSAIDAVGNISEPARAVFKSNKFRPFTVVSDIVESLDDFGKTTMRVLGRGFREDGLVTRLVLDRDGKEPYDLDLSLERGDFRVESDRSIGGIEIREMEPGTYRLGLFHPKRLWFFAGKRVSFEASGTIKFGERGPDWRPSWALAARSGEPVPVYRVLGWLLVALVLGGILLSGRGLAQAAREGEKTRLEVIALMEGAPMPSGKRAERLRDVKKRSNLLRRKFTTTILFLVLLVVVLVAVPLSISMIDTQAANLSAGLRDRALVLLESVASGARSYLPAKVVLELSLLPAQAKAMPDAVYVTITGFNEDAGVEGADFVWASNDPDLAAKTGEPKLRAGRSTLADGLSPEIARIRKELDEVAAREVGEINAAIAGLNEEGIALAGKGDEASQRRLEELNAASRELERSLTEKLSAVAAAGVGSYPPFDPTRLDLEARRYVFYKPVMFRQRQSEIYYRGLVRLEVDTGMIVDQLKSSQERLLQIAAIVALMALGVGAIGAFVLSSIIVIPIRRLVAGIEEIRDAEDRSKLKPVPMPRGARDEIHILTEVVNEMTQGLVKAAVASADLTVGKDTQKMFIPLEKDSMGRKLTTGRIDSVNGLEFFGYYEGAKGVSGDYFDFERIQEGSDRFWGFIKCDVAGKGVPAALIMVEVATIFLNHFLGWTFEKKGIHLDALCYQINELVEGRGFKGRFAAFIVGVYDAQTGAVYLCDAGDKFFRVYEAASGVLVTHELPDSPAAGIFPNFLVEMKNPYRQVASRLEKGDVLVLYTDGIEEAKRHFRDKDFNVIKCPDCKKAGDTHGNHGFDQESEEFGNDRCKDIVEAVAARGSYRLVKAHDPEEGQSLSFSYDTCRASIDDMIMALVSAEKVYRMYRPPKAGADEYVLVDRKIDEFLKRCFDQYRTFAPDKRDNPDPSHPEYVLYMGLREDEQYDDLTLLGVKRT